MLLSDWSYWWTRLQASWFWWRAWLRRFNQRRITRVTKRGGDR